MVSPAKLAGQVPPRIAQHHAMGALAGYRVEEQALDGNEALRSKTPTSKAGRRLGEGRAPSGKQDGTAHRAAAR
jgi:hypothetical protein